MRCQMTNSPQANVSRATSDACGKKKRKREKYTRAARNASQLTKTRIVSTHARVCVRENLRTDRAISSHTARERGKKTINRVDATTENRETADELNIRYFYA